MSTVKKVAEYEDVYRWDCLVIGYEDETNFEQWEQQIKDTILTILALPKDSNTPKALGWMKIVMREVCLETMECVSVIPWYNKQ